YDAARFTDDLTDVLKDSAYNSDVTATTGTPSYTAPNLSWLGPVAAGASTTITYSVTVKNPDTGDHSMLNTVVSPTVGGNCAASSVDPLCKVTVPISELTVTKTADGSKVSTPAKVGDLITYNFSAK